MCLSACVLSAVLVGQVFARGSDHFDYFIFAQIYPTAVCQVDNRVTPDSCEIPNRTANWTIHGLWPTRRDGSYPRFCHSGKGRFRPDDLTPIENTLEVGWPNLFTGKSKTSLWKHEWDKHGTCAASLPSTSGELNFFGVSLRLHEQYSVEDALQQGGIIASNDQTYHLMDINKAIQSALTNGHTIKVHCLKDRMSGTHLLADIRICVDKDFQPIDCYTKSSRFTRAAMPSYEQCPDEGIRYIPSASGVVDRQSSKEGVATDKQSFYKYHPTAPPAVGASGPKWTLFSVFQFLSRLLNPIKLLKF